MTQPAAGTMLFVASRVRGQRIEPVVRRGVPFFVALTAGLLIVVFVPEISMWLP